MKKIDLPYLNTYRDRHGKLRCTYRRGRFRVPIKAAYGTEAFLAEYWSIHNGYKDAEEKRTDTFGALVEAYYKSPAFTQRTSDTRAEYKRHIEDARNGWGEIPLLGITRRAVLIWRDSRGDRPPTANAGVEVLRKVFNWAIEYEWPIKENPCLRITALVEKDTDGWAPWPKAALREWALNSRGIPRYAFFLALMTGQRRADVLKMPWDRIEAGGVHVEQSKLANTSNQSRLWIPIHPLLKEELDRLKAEQVARYEKRLKKGKQTEGRVYILQKERVGGAYSEDGFGTLWNREQHRLGLRFPFHGLRKNATIALLEAGCTADQVKAITGHRTDEMLKLYGRRVNQKKLARQAMRRLEQSDIFAEEPADEGIEVTNPGD